MFWLTAVRSFNRVIQNNIKKWEMPEATEVFSSTQTHTQYETT